MAISQAQIYAGLRYAGGYIATGGAILVTLGALPPDTAHNIVDASQKVLTDLHQLIGDGSALAVLVFPIIMGLLAKMGWNSARLDKLLKNITSNTDVKVDGKIIVPPAVAAAVPSPQVVSNGAPHV